MSHIRFTFLLFVALTISTSCNQKAAEQSTGTGYLPVTKVVDGDTFWANDGSPKGIKVRFIGVNAPESRKTFNKDIQYFGQEAKEYLTGMLTGKKVRLVLDVDSLDKYGRTLAYVYLEDGTFVNADLVKNGYAQVMTIPPNVKHANEFVQLQREARENKRGLWKDEEEVMK